MHSSTTEVSGLRSTAAQAMRLGRRASFAIALTASASMALAVNADAKNLTAACGQVISAPGVYTLQNNVGPCTTIDGFGISIEASGVTLNLAGHTLTGGGGVGEGPGVQIVGSRSDVVENGTIADFDTGVLLTQTQTASGKLVLAIGNTVTGLTLTGNDGQIQSTPAQFSGGVSMVGGRANVIAGNTITQNTDGIALVDTDNANTIANNTAINNSNHGVALYGNSNNNQIVQNVVSNNAGRGVSIAFSSAGNVVRSNMINGNGTNGVRTSTQSDRTVVVNNQITNNGRTGVSFAFSRDNVTTGNTITGNGTAAGAAAGGNADGVFLSGGSTAPGNIPLGGNVVRSNTIEGNVGSGIRSSCTTDANGACAAYAQGNRILNNVVSGNGGAAAGTNLLNGGGFLIGTYDLLDGNNAIDDAATTPPGAATDCEGNTWSGNYTGTQTAYPACTTN